MKSSLAMLLFMTAWLPDSSARSDLPKNALAGFRSSAGHTRRLAVACGQRIASCGQENAPKPAPASQNHAFGQEIAGKRARKPGPTANWTVSCKLADNHLSLLGHIRKY